MNAVAKPAETRPADPMGQFRHQLEAMGAQFAPALPEHVTPEKFGRVVMTAVQGNADLLTADRKSLWEAAMKCAQDGLLPDGREAAFVVFNTKAGKKVQYMPMMAGILTKVRRSGELSSLSANVVRKNDKFQFLQGDDERLDHMPCLDGDPGPPIGAYAIARTKDGGVYREFMTYAEIERVRQVSRAKDSGPWKDWWGEMAKKTVIRRLSKRLPMSTDIQAVITRDDELYDFGRRPALPQAAGVMARLAAPKPDAEGFSPAAAEQALAAPEPEPQQDADTATAPLDEFTDDDFPGDR